MVEKLYEGEYRFKHEDKTMHDIDLDKVKQVADKYLTVFKPYYAMVVDNGRVIFAFYNDEWYTVFKLKFAQKDEQGNEWTQCGEEKVFTWQDKDSTRKVVVAEFWTDAKFEYEESKYISG